MRINKTVTINGLMVTDRGYSQADVSYVGCSPFEPFTTCEINNTQAHVKCTYLLGYT